MENEENPTEKEAPQKKGVVNSLLIGGIGVFCAFYLFNPGWGWIELINDNLPIVGNLDEAAAAALLISCLAFFGFDFGNLFDKAGKSKKSKPTEQADEVIDV